MRLGPTEVALRPRSPSSQSGASRIEWKFDFSCREWMDCLVECEQLGSAGSMWCNMFSGRQQTRARERVLNRTLQSNTRDALEGGYMFFYSGSGAQEYTLGDETEAGWPRGGFIAARLRRRKPLPPVLAQRSLLLPTRKPGSTRVVMRGSTLW